MDVARLTRPLLRLVAAVLLLQAVIAPAHCLAMAAAPAGLEVVICSTEGMRTVHLGPDGQEKPAGHEEAGFCAACPVPPHAVLPDPPAAPRAAWTGESPAWHAATPAALPPPARGPPFASRAPPSFG
jgi:hypothetical protein